MKCETRYGEFELKPKLFQVEYACEDSRWKSATGWGGLANAAVWACSAEQAIEKLRASRTVQHVESVTPLEHAMDVIL